VLTFSSPVCVHVLIFSSPVCVHVMMVNSTNVQYEGLRIGGVGHRMNSKVKSVKQDVYRKVNVVVNLVCFQSVPRRPFLAPIYRWPGLKEREGSDTYYNIGIRHKLIF
jgi:hypothetical protein